MPHEICEMKQANTWETRKSVNNQTNRSKKKTTNVSEGGNKMFVTLQ